MRALLGILAIFCAGVISGQQQPQFIMPIWFEDSQGNKDTIWVGGDPSASSQQINPQFGEVAITAPFDSVFEVRGVHRSDYNWKTSKVIVEHDDYSADGCYLAAHTRIMIHAKYPPVKISWDTVLLATNYPCNINTVLTPDQLIFLIPNWYEARIIYCMMTRTYIQIDNLFPIPPPDQLMHPFEVEGQGIRDIPGLWFTGVWDIPYCYTILPAQEISPSEQISIFPNPVVSYLNISNLSDLEIREVKIINLSGQTLHVFVNESGGKQIEISTEALLAGFYFIQIVLEDGRMVTKKIVKA